MSIKHIISKKKEALRPAKHKAEQLKLSKAFNYGGRRKNAGPKKTDFSMARYWLSLTTQAMIAKLVEATGERPDGIISAALLLYTIEIPANVEKLARASETKPKAAGMTTKQATRFLNGLKQVQ